MPNTGRMRIIPETRRQCAISIVAGLLLAVISAVTLATTTVRAPALEIVVGVLGVLMVVFALIGLASPGMRGR
jgi:hypothetical protein